MQSPGGRVVIISQAAVLATLLVVSSCLTGPHLCPRSLDCARAGRHFCRAGGFLCGPCLSPLVEDAHGRCVLRRRRVAHPAAKTHSYPELDQEIDFLSTIISEQRETKARLPAPLSQDFPKHKEAGPIVPAPALSPASSAQLSAKAGVTQTAIPTAAAPPTNANHTTALLSAPKSIPYPPSDNVFIVLCSVFVAAGSLALVVAGLCWVRLQKRVRLSKKIEYPTYGLMRAHSFDNNVPGDKKLAHSAQMYHYQHQKQQMLSLEKHRDETKVADSGATSDEETEDGDFTVYECPGLAPTGEMEVKNPLFDDSTLYLKRFHK